MPFLWTECERSRIDHGPLQTGEIAALVPLAAMSGLGGLHRLRLLPVSHWCGRKTKMAVGLPSSGLSLRVSNRLQVLRLRLVRSRRRVAQSSASLPSEQWIQTSVRDHFMELVSWKSVMFDSVQKCAISDCHNCLQPVALRAVTPPPETPARFASGQKRPPLRPASASGYQVSARQRGVVQGRSRGLPSLKIDLSD
jgi:hypothetical protein